MVNQGRTTDQLPVKNALYDNDDKFIILYGASTNGTSNSIAQTALISVTKAFAANGSLRIPVLTSDPANSTSMTIGKGSVFATSNFFYVADADNHTVRVALSSF